VALLVDRGELLMGVPLTDIYKRLAALGLELSILGVVQGRKRKYRVDGLGARGKVFVGVGALREWVEEMEGV